MTIEERIAYYKAADPFDTWQNLAKGSGKTRASLVGLARWSKRAGYLGVAVGVALSAYRIRQNPTPCVVAEEVGGTAGGLGGALGGGAGGAAVGAAVFGGPVGWGVAVFTVTGAVIGSYTGDRSARYVIRKIGSCDE